MALKLSFTNDYGDTNDYIEISEFNVRFQDESGMLIFRTWSSQAAKTAGYSPSDESRIPLGPTNEVDDDGCVIQGSYAVFKDSTEADLYVKAKTQKIRTSRNIILDLTTALCEQFRNMQSEYPFWVHCCF